MHNNKSYLSSFFSMAAMCFIVVSCNKVTRIQGGSQAEAPSEEDKINSLNIEEHKGSGDLIGPERHVITFETEEGVVDTTIINTP